MREGREGTVKTGSPSSYLFLCLLFCSVPFLLHLFHLSLFSFLSSFSLFVCVVYECPLWLRLSPLLLPRISLLRRKEELRNHNFFPHYGSLLELCKKHRRKNRENFTLFPLRGREQRTDVRQPGGSADKSIADGIKGGFGGKCCNVGANYCLYVVAHDHALSISPWNICLGNGAVALSRRRDSPILPRIFVRHNQCATDSIWEHGFQRSLARISRHAEHGCSTLCENRMLSFVCSVVESYFHSSRYGPDYSPGRRSPRKKRICQKS